jgi:hypothetical protein
MRQPVLPSAWPSTFKERDRVFCSVLEGNCSWVSLSRRGLCGSSTGFISASLLLQIAPFAMASTKPRNSCSQL